MPADFELQDWRLYNALERGPVLLVFFKISCPTCQFALPFLQAFEGSDLQIVLISQDDQKGTSQFLNRFQITLRTLLDKPRDFPVSNTFRITHVPSLFLIEPDKTVSLAVDGFDKAALDQLGARFAVAPFGNVPSVPALKPG